MRRIDAEFDIPQFLASSLVRTIAASNFRVPESKREKFQKLPDDVIARVEAIVRHAYLEVGVAVGGDALRGYLRQQAFAARREMIANAELIPESDFRERLGITKRSLEKIVADGSVFAMEVDETQYFPSQLVDPSRNQKRLQAICRIIAPAPATSRLDFLTSPRGSLGDQIPLEMLDDDIDFKRLQTVAAAWAAEWSRTTVTMYEGEHDREPKELQPLYTAAAEIDPRRPLWERASEALYTHGYEWPLGPYRNVREFTLFVERQTAGQPSAISEARVNIAVDGEVIRIRIAAASGTTLGSKAFDAGKNMNLISLAKRVIANLKASAIRLADIPQNVRSPSHEGAAATDEVMSTKEAAVILCVSRQHVVKLINDRLLPLHHRVGKARFVRTVDVLAYKEKKLVEATVWLANQAEDKGLPGQ
ncbi:MULTISPECIES: helix-turn-helix domain-containing protein [unclassified Caballeronia]|uniref:helix-turn-helix domain-containing protein n=1 Tax=unclassified Caballeronia TaxID=2646786 RepID=UPI00285F5112|nr:MULTISPECIES: helix-turn-helix domain-containing protein [unclassified Caballeronia]MDR5751354.1 helix-turn-helix domain-containing protein [Caballeronia sp. LZ024]MDR5844504.1 helix-turn-helix domain-containing protein [Caballeronia sp. LZ031]